MKKNAIYRTDQLFNMVNEKLMEDGLLPDILDYSLSSRYSFPVKNVVWDCVGRVNFGGSEGIYLDMYLSGDTDGTGVNGDHLFATYKTLERDDDIFLQMAILGAKFSLETYHWLGERLDDFTWTGYDIAFLLGGKEKYRVTCYDSIENIRKYIPAKAEHIPHDSIVITDNSTDSDVPLE